MDYDYSVAVTQAERHFSKARTQAFWSNLIDKVFGRSTDLLDFNEVKHKLRLNDEHYLGRQDVPLDNIVGSVGRYRDFTRKFLPKRSVNRDRWKAVDMMTLQKGYPPIELYKVGDAYFVIDGNHRVSVARANNMKTIEAFVTELRTPVPFDKDTRAEDLLIKEGYAHFLRQTRLLRHFPDAQVILTEPTNYREILHHIQVHHYYLGINCDCPVEWDEAVMSWYETVYLPMVRAIREYGILAEFPNRTEADLYVWLLRHQALIQEVYGGAPPSPQDTVGDFIDKLHS
ncbi:MAG: hypothetical protein ACLFTK_09925 [Anaerolineales bacterium]